MELDELKKSWSILDEQLKDKKIINEEEISKLIGYTGKNINAITRLNIKLILISLAIFLLLFALIVMNEKLNFIFFILTIAMIPALGWDMFSTRYIQRTQIDEMPLVEVIGRVNRMRRWIINERIIGVIFIFILAIVSFLYWQVWQYGIFITLLFGVTWGSGIACVLFYQRTYMKRIKEIQKNLDELKEIVND